MTKPVFVIGKNRCGTKWLSNCIANHPQIACVQDEDFSGILETNFFSQFSRVFGDISKVENYCALAACFSKTSFFKFTGLPESMLFEKHLNKYPAFFRRIMDAYAEQQGCDFWLQKASPLALPILSPSFADARFIIINRNLVDSVRSGLALAQAQHPGRKGIIGEVALAQLSDRMAAAYEKQENILSLRYEDLRDNRKRTLEGVCAFLNLPWTDDLMEDRWHKNTSFSSRKSREKILSPREVLFLRTCEKAMAMLPLSVLRFARKHLGRAVNPHAERFVAGTFLAIRKEQGW